ncbi:MAG TPA: AraC family transcriptional regulator [Puia sp.]|uniref:helix-turn-helix domain-containing protein n=1 Tax=Puia sp. TaxID=2045100 RepID=UPI002C4F65D3|nr:AraC family transcriptional regulator [Puia sp.]HVU98737.1 AraC family transcriptional regulator [Puia sp.]
MIVSQQYFELGNKRVIEKFIIQTPFRLGATFQNEACFVYFKEGKTILSSPTERLAIGATESVLLNCSNYFADFLPKAPLATIEVYAVHLYPDLLKEIYKDTLPEFLKHKAAGQNAKLIDNHSIINHFIDSLVFYFENPGLVNSELLVLKIKELILLLLQTHNATTIAELMADLFSPREVNLKEVIQLHLFSNFSITELAQLAGLSLSSFKRAFQNIYHDTPANYLRTKKIEKAMDLLTQSDLSVSEICFQIGFNDASHFTKAFKKHTKQSPLAFRSAHRP